MSTERDRLLHVAEDVIRRARALGADAAEVLILTERELTAKVRLGAPELVQQASSRGLGLRVIRDHRSAVCHTADLSPEGLAELTSQAMSVATLSEPDPDADPPPSETQATSWPDLDLHDPATAAITANQALRFATDAETAARDADSRITNSEGATYATSEGLRILVTSSGFAGHYRSTYVSLVVEPIADDADGKKRNGFWWDGRRHLAQLAAPAKIGEEAARRTVAQLGARKVSTRRVPVIFSREAGAQVIQSLAALVNGNAAYRGATYLVDKEGSDVASSLVTVTDDPLLKAGPGSRPFDGEGLPCRSNAVIEAGRFQAFLCDTYAGRRLGCPSTASAGRGLGNPPSVTTSNFYLAPGDQDPDALIKDTGEGLYVTKLMGFGFNPVTGDFSKGAEGFWIDKGERAFPVSEVTVSCNLDDLLRGIDALANDLDHKSSVCCPTFRVRRMTLAGS